jgi:hypothetical protein
MLPGEEIVSMFNNRDSDNDKRSVLKEISETVYGFRLKDVTFLTQYPSFVFKLNREWGEVRRFVNDTEGV